MDYFFIDGVAVLALGYTMNLSNPVKTLGKVSLTTLMPSCMLHLLMFFCF